MRNKNPTLQVVQAQSVCVCVACVCVCVCGPIAVASMRVPVCVCGMCAKVGVWQVTMQVRSAWSRAM